MKMSKKMLLAGTVAGVLIVSAGTGTYSWFTSETEAQGEMVNGTLGINNGEDIETPIFEGDKFAPSQLEYGNWLSISNTGDLDTYLKATYSHSVDQATLEDYEVGYMAMKYTAQPGEDVYEDSEIELANLFDGTTNERASTFDSPDGVEIVGGIMTQEQAMAMMDDDSGEIVIGEGEDDASFWGLQEGEYIDVMFGLKLDESAGNEHQGATYNATFNVIGKQTDDGAQFENE